MWDDKKWIFTHLYTDLYNSLIMGVHSWYIISTGLRMVQVFIISTGLRVLLFMDLCCGRKAQLLVVHISEGV